MTSVKSKLKASVQAAKSEAAKSQVVSKSGANEPQPKPRTTARTPKPAGQAASPTAAKSTAGQRLAALFDPVDQPAASAGKLFPTRVWPD
ncbi:MAG: hypothetical protein B7Z78_00425 [Rhodospirillales bacterium 20-60-12]|nr:MAG: hypothetical protein B7Z78_00425 [Rhodospirillales bacterium 20-60-12]HQT68133.1 hypothetical protein [Acetobacteraceae bacterium]